MSAVQKKITIVLDIWKERQCEKRMQELTILASSPWSLLYLCEQAGAKRLAEHNIRHALPQGVQLPRPPVNDRLPRAGPGGELGVEPTQEWVRRRLARRAALERVVVPRTFGAQPDGLVVVPGVILGRVCGRRGQCPLPPDAATTWPTAPTRRSTSSSPSSMQRSRGAPTACSAVRRRVVLVVLFW